MWIMLNNAFLSIVAVTEETMRKAGIEGKPDDWFSVRARNPDHITRTFPDAHVLTWPGRDYVARAIIRRREVVRVMAERMFEIDYGNFKDSVEDEALHDAYLNVWSSMYDYQLGELDRSSEEEVIL